jgi:hypothetical protein
VRNVWLVAAAAAAGLTFVSAAAPSSNVHLLVQPRHPVALWSAPNGRVLALVPVETRWSSPTSFAVLERRGSWLRVVSDLLPNNRTGWIAAAGAPVRSTRLMVRIDLSARRLTVLLGSSVLRKATVAVGAPGTPTPTGVFSITDKLDSSGHAGWTSAYGCCVLALSGHQTRLPSGWSSGDRLAIHGGTGLGTAVSAGCVHANEKLLRYLMRRLPLGTLVQIGA